MIQKNNNNIQRDMTKSSVEAEIVQQFIYWSELRIKIFDEIGSSVCR